MVGLLAQLSTVLANCNMFKLCAFLEPKTKGGKKKQLEKLCYLVCCSNKALLGLNRAYAVAFISPVESMPKRGAHGPRQDTRCAEGHTRYTRYTRYTREGTQGARDTQGTLGT